jgi:nickel superoxide dismutase
MSRKSSLVAVAVLAVLVLPQVAAAHCQVPCGIYDDAARVHALYEDATTIEKSMRLIVALSEKDDAQSANQFARWVTTKESHAANIITTVAEYFLTQKVKPVAAGAEGYDAYLAKLGDHHLVMAAAMKAKQSADPEVVGKLRTALKGMAAHYDLPHNH